MSDYFLGIDIGGSKTHALIANSDGEAVGFGQAGAGNHEVVGYDGLVNATTTAFEQALKNSGILSSQIKGAGYGVAGYDWPSELFPTTNALDQLKIGAPREIYNDAVLGLIAGASQGWGIVINAGTSNNVHGRDRLGKPGYITGCGSTFGEFGGAAELVGAAVRVISHAWSRRGPETKLAEAFIQRVGACDLTDLLEGLSQLRYDVGPEEALLVFQVAHAGDSVARKIIAWSGRELGYSAIAVIRQLELENQEFEVVLSGSMLNQNDPLLIAPMKRVIRRYAPRAVFVRLAVRPVVGAVLLGMEAAGMNYHDKRLRLIESSAKLLGGL